MAGGPHLWESTTFSTGDKEFFEKSTTRWFERPGAEFFLDFSGFGHPKIRFHGDRTIHLAGEFSRAYPRGRPSNSSMSLTTF